MLSIDSAFSMLDSGLTFDPSFTAFYIIIGISIVMGILSYIFHKPIDNTIEKLDELSNGRTTTNH